MTTYFVKRDSDDPRAWLVMRRETAPDGEGATTAVFDICYSLEQASTAAEHLNETAVEPSYGGFLLLATGSGLLLTLVFLVALDATIAALRSTQSVVSELPASVIGALGVLAGLFVLGSILVTALSVFGLFKFTAPRSQPFK